jgi:hypothetical protein
VIAGANDELIVEDELVMQLLPHRGGGEVQPDLCLVGSDAAEVRVIVNLHHDARPFRNEHRRALGERHRTRARRPRAERRGGVEAGSAEALIAVAIRVQLRAGTVKRVTC